MGHAYFLILLNIFINFNSNRDLKEKNVLIFFWKHLFGISHFFWSKVPHYFYHLIEVFCMKYEIPSICIFFFIRMNKCLYSLFVCLIMKFQCSCILAGIFAASEIKYTSNNRFNGDIYCWFTWIEWNCS